MDNMPSIIEHGLMPRNMISTDRNGFIDVADPDIINKRNNNNLNNYIPFHFHPYTSFDYAVKLQNPDKEFVYISLKRDFARYSGFKVIPAHPLSGEGPILYDYDEGFARIDWDAVQQDAGNNDHAKQVKMAECLTDRIIPASLFQNVYVHDERTKNYIETLFIENGITEQPPYVVVMPQWV